MVSISCDNVNDVPIVDEWNFGSKIELLMHSIHAYPAKFPAFIASKAFDYAKNEDVFQIRRHDGNGSITAAFSQPVSHD